MLPDLDLIVQAQVAAEERLAYCSYLEEDAEEPYDGEVSEPCAPFCGCNTCVVREVLDAAYPFLLLLARHQVKAEQN